MTGPTGVERGADHAAADGAGRAENERRGAVRFIVPLPGYFLPHMGRSRDQVVALHGAGHGEADDQQRHADEEGEHHDHQPGRAGAVPTASPIAKNPAPPARSADRQEREEGEAGALRVDMAGGPVGMAHKLGLAIGT